MQHQQRKYEGRTSSDVSLHQIQLLKKNYVQRSTSISRNGYKTCYKAIMARLYHPHESSNTYKEHADFIELKGFIKYYRKVGRPAAASVLHHFQQFLPPAAHCDWGCS
ncbi:unnamed protein product [Cylindrotheca closterium]|uniref:Uncharacterized protein n=1 Tax=Cylindrotheca closterium TaxID=2856 RepID=A0AAD2JL28_9STRA|nr:unnamed protein product [Cylindrotheca closterium]